MDGFVLLGLIAALALLLGPIGFFVAIGHGRRIADLEGKAREARTDAQRLAARLASFESGERSSQFAAAPPPLPAPPPVRASAAEAPPPIVEEPLQVESAPGAADVESAPDAAPADAASLQATQDATVPPSPPPVRRPSLEEALGARWTVWVGGLALALGALLLVRYSIQQGFFGPGLRVLLGLALAAALVGGGEALRRREGAAGRVAGFKSADIPGALTAAGTVAAFGSIYAAHALYGFIGPGLAFAALGATGVAALAAALLHGPALAALGLVGSLATPLLVAAERPNAWPVVVYVGVVVAATYWLARLRLWLWLALSGAAGGAAWTLALRLGASQEGTDFYHAALVALVLQSALAAAVFAFASSRDRENPNPKPDAVAHLVLLGFAFVALIVLNLDGESLLFDAVWVLVFAIEIAIFAATGFARTAAAGASALAGALALGAMAEWPTTDGAALAPSLHDALLMSHWAAPMQATLFILVSIAAALATAGLAGKRLFDGADLPLAPAATYAASAALTPLGALLVANARLSDGAVSMPMAAAAAIAAALFVAAAAGFQLRLAARESPATRLALGAVAAAAIAALAAGLVFALDGGALTVALALGASATAYVSTRLEIPTLRWAVAALGVAIAARLAWEPRIVGAALSPTPIFNWLLFGYGAPALALGVAARLLRRGGEDVPTRVCDALTVVFSALLVFFEIRHAMNGGNPFARGSSLVEQALMTISAFGFALVLRRLDAGRANIVFRIASLVAGAAGVALGVVGLLLIHNPLFDGRPVEGGVALNALILAYLMPAALAAIFARLMRGAQPAAMAVGASVGAIVFLFAYASLETRRVFQGAAVGLDQATSDGEWYAFSAVWLLLGLALLAFGVWRGSREARYASAFFVIATTLKVFLFDLAGLEGVLRALSFMGLGAALIGVGLVYQKLVFARPAAVSGPQPTSGPP
ncbi:MAG: DUF2339 domain-containing protein [Roseiarcus sp.]